MEPRPLSERERAALVAVLEHAPFDGQEAVLAQVDVAEVVAGCECGCASVDLRVPENAPVPLRAPGVVPNDAAVLDAEGQPVGGVLVFLDGGRLSLLEVFSYGEPITPFPAVEQLLLSVNARRGPAG